MSQTSYPRDFNVAVAGLQADTEIGGRIESSSAEGVVDFGLGIVAGTLPASQVKIAATSGDTFRGVAVFVQKQDGQYNDKETVNVLRQGNIWVPATDPVVLDAAVYVDLVTTTGTFTSNSSSNLATGAIFRSVKNAQNLAQIELNLP